MSQTIAFLSLAHDGPAIRARTQEMLEGYCFGKAVAKPSLWLRNRAELRTTLKRGDTLVSHKFTDLFTSPTDMVSFVTWALGENIAVHTADVGELTERLAILRVLGEAFAPLDKEVIKLRQQLTIEQIQSEGIEENVTRRVTKAVKAALEQLDILTIATQAKEAAVAETPKPKPASEWQPMQGTKWQ
ncbi:MAG: hypothetical protein ACKVP3_11105 [Hyphomicrobiaceae bacterium]